MSLKYQHNCIKTITGNDVNHDFSCHLVALAYNNRGHLRYLKVDFTEAVSDYTAALQHCHSIAVIFYNRGLIHYRLGNEDAIIWPWLGGGMGKTEAQGRGF